MRASYEPQAAVKQILLDIIPCLDEKQRRILYKSAAAVLGHGGITFVNEVTGSARSTIFAGKIRRWIRYENNILTKTLNSALLTNHLPIS